MSFSDYWELQVLEKSVEKSDIATGTGRFIALYTAAPSDAGGGTEVSGGAYERKSTAAADWAAAAAGQIQNGLKVTFVKATADWGTVSHFGIFDALTAGNLLTWGTITPNKPVSNGDQPFFDPSQLTITLD